MISLDCSALHCSAALCACGKEKWWKKIKESTILFKDFDQNFSEILFLDNSSLASLPLVNSLASYNIPGTT